MLVFGLLGGLVTGLMVGKKENKSQKDPPPVVGSSRVVVPWDSDGHLLFNPLQVCLRTYAIENGTKIEIKSFDFS